MPNLEFIAHYPEHLKDQIRRLIHEKKLGAYLLSKYSTTHNISSDKALYAYVMELRSEFLRKSEPITKVLYDGKISDINDALGLHRVTIKNHGGRLRSKSEIRVASVFKNTPEAFLRMIVVHELSHLKEREHNKAFYAMCEKMEPSYHQLEFDVRLYMTHLELFGKLY
ncbi:M48 metallopeptidase family protein [Sulfurospirillum sp.]|uniref:M48 metallopeptidase family protein n=1 Tax=Sulfurospirillum sp. TaxID=2053622 RepID=UPI002FDF071A